MNIPKGQQPSASPPVQIGLQPRNITQQQRGQTPPLLRTPDDSYQTYQQQYNPGGYTTIQYGISPTQTYTHDLTKQSMSNPRMPNPALAAAAQQMYNPQQQQGMAGMRAQTPPFFTPGQPQNMGARGYPRPVTPNQQGQQVYPMVYNIGQPGTYPTPGTQIIVQPGQMGQVMIQPGQRMPTPPFTTIPSSQPGVPFQVATNAGTTLYNATGNSPYNATGTSPYSTSMYYPQQQQQPQRPPSGSGMNMPPAPAQKRERQLIKIVDPNTGKDISNEILHTSSTHRLTPPGQSGSGSGSRSTPVSEPSTSPPGIPQNEIAAEFAEKVAATLRPGMRQYRPPSQTPPQPHIVSSQDMPPQSVSPGQPGMVAIQQVPMPYVPNAQYVEVNDSMPMTNEMEQVQVAMPSNVPLMVDSESPVEKDVQRTDVVVEVTRTSENETREFQRELTPPESTDSPPQDVKESSPPVVEEERIPSVVEEERSPSVVEEERSPSVVEVERSPSVVEEERSPSVEKTVSPRDESPVASDEVIVLPVPQEISVAPPVESTITVSENILTEVVQKSVEVSVSLSNPDLEERTIETSSVITVDESTDNPVHVESRERTPEQETEVEISASAAAAPSSKLETVAVGAEAASAASASEGESPKDISAPKDVKKEKGKRKLKVLNKKGEEMQGTEMDAFIDSEAPNPGPSQDAVSEETTEVVAEVVAEVVELDKAESSPPVNPQPQEESPEPTVVEEKVPTVEIKIEDPQVTEENAKNKEKSNEVNEEKSNEVNEEEEEEPTAKTDSKSELRYKYKEDQWSPLNMEGKRQYDRDFLLQMQYSNDSTVKPEGLPDLPEIILDRPHPQHGGQRDSVAPRISNRDFARQDSGMFDFTPGFVKGTPGRGPGGHGGTGGHGGGGGGSGGGGGGGGGGGRDGGGINKRSSGQGRRMERPGEQKKIIAHVSISQDIKLHQADNAWKPPVKGTKGEDEDADDEELYKKAKSILNKLTPQKFQKLVKQMAELKIDTETKLKAVTDLVFEKAISEPGFSVAYANMCRYLITLKVPSETKPGADVNFRAVLLTKCQRQFELDKETVIEVAKKKKEIEEAESEEKKKELKMYADDFETKAKRRSLGNIRFIGELFKLKMLTETIMHDCLLKLLQSKDAENHECLCRLLTTIGKELDVDKAKFRIDQYFQQMAKIVTEKKTSSRVRFMLQDIIELRKRKWVPRRDDNNPKTIDQIHREVQKEAEERAIAIQQLPNTQHRGGRGGGPGSGGRGRGPPGFQGGGGSDGWNTVATKPMRPVDRTIDHSKLKLSKQNVVDEGIQLGPGGGARGFSAWQRGSAGGGAKSSQEKEKPNTPSNRFSALSNKEDEGRRGFGGVSPARGDSRGRNSAGGGFGRPSGSKLTPRSSQELERERAIAAVKSVIVQGKTSSEGPSRESSRGREPRKVEPKKEEREPEKPAVKQLTEEEMEKKTISILDEFLHLQDIKEAILCVSELKSPNTLHTFVAAALNHVLERSQIARKQTGHLLHDLVKQKLLPVETYLKGLMEVVQFAEDMEIDIPKIWKYFGELIGPMIQDGSVPLSFLKQAAEPLKQSKKAGIFVAEILHDASSREGHKKVADLWLSSDLQWTDFVSKPEVEEFLSAQKLEYLAGADSVPTSPTIGQSIDRIQVNLAELLKKKVDNEELFDWIEGNVDEPTTKKSPFIRVLMTDVCSSAITGQASSEHVDPQEIKKRSVLLQKYLDHQPDFELQALYALQALVHKLEHPQGVLRTLFDTLYDEDIISEDAFNQWEKSADPAEQEGKGVAMKQVVQFFTWLREAEEEDQEES